MKSLIKITLLSSAIMLALAGCNEKNKFENKHLPVTSQSTTSNTAFSTDAQKEAYALGSSFATYLKGNLENEQINIDTDYVVNGFNETFRGESRLTKDEIQSILAQFGQRLQQEATARFEKQKAENTANGEKFRTNFAKQQGVKKTKSGLLYQIVKDGSGPHPTADDTVIVHYTGTLIDGRKFDSSYDRGETAKFPLNTVIKGWVEGIQLVGVGGKIKLVVPPELAYGDQNIPGLGDKAGIQPASTLVFEVELIGIENQNTKSSQSTKSAK
ncbi:hypothetical protein A9G48_01760 [Gilliamella sp. wkB18]|uniref:FKBP-type peptidyl-prolyl cis-trans isomerase n=1 Tax=Gilliamella sp. wkB18 TaxID=3120260 RepID=UPI0004DD4B1C|nr:FKBP-type peptidyl-prolyl cis-trans isomerase [Gilliamella apicola]KFA58382.1 FKBP-type peptidyl-prolyl cis-trans isomerase FkpA precursor [Gilliamella apicola]OCG64745.1 hypothetical protein A9G48_01760 [Gilliamella apicola]